MSNHKDEGGDERDDDIFYSNDFGIGWDPVTRRPLPKYEHGVAQFLSEDGKVEGAAYVQLVRPEWVKKENGRWYSAFPPNELYITDDGEVCSDKLLKIFKKEEIPGEDWPVHLLRKCPSFYEGGSFILKV